MSQQTHDQRRVSRANRLIADGGRRPEERRARRERTEERLGEVAQEWGGIRCGLCEQDVDLDPDDPQASWDDHVREVHAEGPA